MTGVDPADRLRQVALELASMAQTGLAFASDQYDLKRYRRMRELSAELLTDFVDTDPAALVSQLELDGGYATPHLDVRGILVEDGKILLVRETLDGRWTLPGGWADVLDTPRGAIEREFAEEAGLAIRATRVAFVHDGTVHNGHLRRGPIFHIWKLFFVCERAPDDADRQAEPLAGLDGETTEVAYFGPDELPPRSELSLGRVTAEQLALAFASVADPSRPAEAD